MAHNPELRTPHKKTAAHNCVDRLVILRNSSVTCSQPAILRHACRSQRMAPAKLHAPLFLHNTPLFH